MTKLKLSSILLFSENPKALGEFYEKVLGEAPGWSDGGYIGFDTGSCYLTIGPHDKVKGKSTQPERVMLNLETDDVKREYERIKEAADPTVIAEPYAMDGENYWIATLADPDGNYFQLVTPFDMDVDLSKN